MRGGRDREFLWPSQRSTAVESRRARAESRISSAPSDPNSESSRALLTVSFASGQEIGVTKFPDGEVRHVVRADDTPRVPCPETMPPGCEVAMLEGDLASEDLFTCASG